MVRERQALHTASAAAIANTSRHQSPLPPPAPGLPPRETSPAGGGDWRVARVSQHNWADRRGLNRSFPYLRPACACPEHTNTGVMASLLRGQAGILLRCGTAAARCPGASAIPSVAARCASSGPGGPLPIATDYEDHRFGAWRAPCVFVHRPITPPSLPPLLGHLCCVRYFI